MSNVTSYEIKTALAKKHRKDFFLTECKSGSTWMSAPGEMKILDGLAIRKSWSSPCFTGYEIKISRSDFLRDSKFYTYEEIVNCLYIVCPKGMIERTELPESVGLMYYDPEKKTLTTRKKAIYRKIEYGPDLLLYIIYSRLDSDRIPFYSDKEDYFRDYVARKIDGKKLGYCVRSRLIDENRELINKLEGVRRFEQQRENYEKIIAVARKHGLSYWNTDYLAEDLDKRLSRSCPDDISSIRKTLEHCVERIKIMEEKKDETADL